VAWTSLSAGFAPNALKETIMTFSRRKALYVVGGATAALVGAGGVFSATRMPNRAHAPWAAIETAPPADIRLDAFRHAILAPNPHNRQPWRIKLVGTDQALISCDLEKRLPQTDPFDRQILIGFGCFLELARIAAAERGFRMDIEPFPQGLPGDRLDTRPVAAVRFVQDASIRKDPLFRFIATRRSNKRPYDTAKPADPLALAALAASATGQSGLAVFATNDERMVQSLRALSWDAWLIEFQTLNTWQETVDLMRIGKAEIEANPDGVSIGGAFLDMMAQTGQLTREKMATPGSFAHNAAIGRSKPVLASGMAYSWIITETNTRQDQLNAGQAWVRANLEATRQNLGFQPISQSLQEFAEMKAEYAKVHTMLGAKPGQCVQMLARLGYGEAIDKTPRWPLASKLVSA
jgi:nitroreductase